MWEGETGPGLGDPTVALSLLPLHTFSVTLRTPFWIQASDQSLSRLLFVLCSGNFVKRRECLSHLPFVCLELTVRFEDLVSHLAFKPADVEFFFQQDAGYCGWQGTGWYVHSSGHAVSVVNFGTETNILAQSGRLRRLCDAHPALAIVQKALLFSSSSQIC